ncbi:TIGR02680 family protein [Lentzea sp. NPDC054927]
MSDPDSTALRGAQLAALLSGAPPVPASTRFKPLRTGLAGIWQYGDEVFNFHDGRLILHGRNGSGKTKVLEVTSPFLLDANLNARRLDPFGSNARSMRDNLLFGGRTHQIGYVWCEYGRITEDGGTEYRTIGAGMRAKETKAGSPDPWYFITPLRVGVDFDLHDNANRPLNDSDLAVRLGGADDSVFTTAEHYRATLARELFGLAPERLHSLVELLIILRRPKLSENLSVASLKEILSDGLPPIDAELVAGLAKNFDDLKGDQDELQRFVKAKEEIDLFLSSYRGYARRMTRHVTGDVLEAKENHRQALGRGKRAKTGLSEIGGAVSKADEDLRLLGEEREGLAGKIRALESGPEMRNQQALSRLQSDVEAARKQASAAKLRATKAANQQLDAEQELEGVTGRLGKAHREVARAEVEAAVHALAAGLRQEFEEESDRLRTDPAGAQLTLHGYITTRRAVVRETQRLLGERLQAQNTVDRLQSTHDELGARCTSAVEHVQDTELRFEEQAELLSKAIVSWSGQCRECALTDDQVAELVATVDQVEDPAAPRLAERIASYFEDVRAELIEQRGTRRTQKETLAADLQSTTAQREQVALETDPPPPVPLVARRDRTEVAGAPLWRLVDFHPAIADDSRAAVEAALLGAGMLDAWVTPDGTLVNPESWDTLLLADRVHTDGSSLMSVLCAVPDGSVPETVVDRILAGIAVVDEQTGDETAGSWVSLDGRWAIGPLRGSSGQEQACYIGTHAREAARRRRLAELDARIAELKELIALADEDLLVFDRRLRALTAEQRAQPVDTAVRDGLSELVAARKHEHELTKQLEKSTERLRDVKEILRRATEALRVYAVEHLTPMAPEQLDAMSSALMELNVAVERLAAHLGAVALLTAQHVATEQRVEQLTADRDGLAGESAEAAAEETRLTKELEEQTQLLGVGINEVLERLKNAKKDLALAVEETKKLNLLQQGQRQRLGALEQQVLSTSADCDQRLAEQQTALTEFQRVRARGFLRLIGESDVDTGSDDLAAAARVHELLAAEESDDAARNNARNDVDDQFRRLQREIDGSDWRPWGDNDGDLFVVQVTFNGADHPVSDLRDLIVDEIAIRGTYVQDKERRLYSDLLLGSMGEHLRQRRLEARKLVDEMDAQLGRHPTASKMLMSIKWKPSDEAGPEVRDAIELLDRGSTSFLASDARDALIKFLTEQVREARERAEHGDWKAHLTEALDYRRWSEFELQVKHHDKPKAVPLTDELHRRGSGGEKAVMLQLPMFAAAAAHYAGAAPTSPRPIYLDEAFAGIDSEMRGSCIGLLTEFDLDFVMASHDEWGFHPTVPGVLTYQLFRDPDVHGVLATPIVWDGTRRYRLEDWSLNTAPPPPILGEQE